MTKQRMWWWVAGILGTAAIATAVFAPRVNIPESERRIQWVDPDAPRRIRAYAAPIEQLVGWPGLGDFLVAVAYIESRGNSQAGSDADTNEARGWYGMRPKSSRATDLGLDPLVVLKNEADATALAAWYAHRMRKEALPGQQLDWLAVRRGWGFPKDVRAVDHPGYWKQLSMGLKAAGLPANWMLTPAFTSSYDWPGVEAVRQAAKGAYA